MNHVNHNKADSSAFESHLIENVKHTSYLSFEQLKKIEECLKAGIWTDYNINGNILLKVLLKYKDNGKELLRLYAENNISFTNNIRGESIFHMLARKMFINQFGILIDRSLCAEDTDANLCSFKELLMNEDGKMQTIFHKLALWNNFAGFKYLTKKCKTTLDDRFWRPILQKATNGFNILHISIANKDIKFVEHLLGHYPELLWHNDHQTINPIDLAFDTGDIDIINMFFNKNAPIIKHKFTYSEYYGWSPMHYALNTGDVPLFTYLFYKTNMPLYFEEQQSISQPIQMLMDAQIANIDEFEMSFDNVAGSATEIEVDDCSKKLNLLKQTNKIIMMIRDYIHLLIQYESCKLTGEKIIIINNYYCNTLITIPREIHDIIALFCTDTGNRIQKSKEDLEKLIYKDL